MTLDDVGTASDQKVNGSLACEKLIAMPALQCTLFFSSGMGNE